MSNATSSTGGADTDLDAALARAIRHLIAEATSEDDRRAGTGQAAAGESAAA
jgi:hypothetical protein